MWKFPDLWPTTLVLGRGSGGYMRETKSAGVSQSVRETGRDESQNVLSTPKLFKTRDLELPIFYFLGISPKLFAALRRIHPYLCTPVLPRGQLVAPYCAIPRDYLSDTPLACALRGFLGVSTWPIGCDTPSPFLSVSPLESARSGGAIPPPPP